VVEGFININAGSWILPETRDEPKNISEVKQVTGKYKAVEWRAVSVADSPVIQGHGTQGVSDPYDFFVLLHMASERAANHTAFEIPSECR